MSAKLQGWTPARLTRQDGKTFVITGANSGIGFEAAKILASQGGHIVLVCRNLQKAEAARATLMKYADGGGGASIVEMDLSDISSIRAGASAIAAAAPRIGALVSNAGIMAPPKRQETKDGFEMQFGVNHLGHFLLAGLLSEHVNAADGRFVSVSSTMHKAGIKRIRFEDPNWKSGYTATAAYAQSKLADALFVRELNNRLTAKGVPARGYICHPGYAATALQTKDTEGVVKNLMSLGNALSAQSAQKGSWPTALCAAGSEAVAGNYYGPTGMFELRGPVGDCKLAPQARDDTAAKKLWALSEELTGHRWTV